MRANGGKHFVELIGDDLIVHHRFVPKQVCPPPLNRVVERKIFDLFCLRQIPRLRRGVQQRRQGQHGLVANGIYNFSTTKEDF